MSEAMSVRIHRGATEIGGSCVEVRAGDATILLDLGRPLWAGYDDVVPLPAAVGLGEPGPPPLAVILSHSHADHWGLVPDLPAGIPVWIGKGAADVLRAAEFWGIGCDLHEAGHLQHRHPIQLGPFTITPYLADHSAFDAYSLLVEAGGRRLFYTGDLRGHGRKHTAFEALLADPPPHLDALLVEGTNLRDETDGASDEATIDTESDVEADLADLLAGTSGLVVVLGSAQNVDRLVTVYRAALRSGRDLGIDLYSAEVAAATGRATIPQLGTDWPRVCAYLPLAQRIKVKTARQFDRTNSVRAHRIFDEALAADPSRWVLYGAYQPHITHLIRSGLLTAGAVVWSLWDGYLEQPRGQALIKNLQAAQIPFPHLHSSGHASVADLRRLVQSLDPAVVVPIHSEAPHRFQDVLDRPVTMRPDGVWWPV